MVLLVITPVISSALECLSPIDRDELSLPAPVLNGAISHQQLIALSRKLSSLSSSLTHTPIEDKKQGTDFATPKTRSKGLYSLNSLLRGTKIFIPPPPPKPAPSPEYLALKARLLAEAQAREYDAYLNRPSLSTSKLQPSPIFSTPSVPRASSSLTEDFSDPISPSLVLNVLVSILFTGFATYWALTNFRTPHFFTTMLSVSNSIPEETHNYPGSIRSQPSRVFISLLVALVVGVAEVTVYAAYLRKVDLAKTKERKKTEKRSIITTVEMDPLKPTANSNAISTEVKREEVWGRGKNRGARRRVKEKWNVSQNAD